MLNEALIAFQLAITQGKESGRTHYPPPIELRGETITSHRVFGPVEIYSTVDQNCPGDTEKHLVYDNRYPHQPFPGNGECLPNGTRFTIHNFGPLSGQ